MPMAGPSKEWLLMDYLYPVALGFLALIWLTRTWYQSLKIWVCIPHLVRPFLRLIVQ
jgi:hypothetical protein